MNMDTKTFGQYIKYIRNERKLTAEKLAQLCNIDATYLRQIEGGKKTPSLPIFISICNALHISPNYILHGNLDKNEMTYVNELLALLDKASPSEIEFSTYMIKAALEYVENSRKV